MSIRRGNSRLPWGAGRGGVYGPRRSNGRPIVLTAIAVALVAAAAFFLFRLCTGGCDTAYCPTDRDIAPPDGYERVSKVYEYDTDFGELTGGNTLDVSFPLTQSTEDSGNLSFYKYLDETDTWEPLASASVESNGEAAAGNIPEAAPFIAILRRLAPAGHVVAYLPPGGSLHRDAAGKVTVLHTLDFAPAADGTISGTATLIPRDPAFAHYPVVSASAASGGDAIVTSILANPQSRSNHVQQIVAKVQEADVPGVDISYMDLKPEQRDSFAFFIGELSTALRRIDRKLTITLPPPTVTNGTIDEGAYDWAAIANAADLVKMTPFRDQSRYRLDVPRLLDHLTTVMDRQKLVLTVTPYATELSSDGVVATMSIVRAMDIATQLAIQGDRLTTDANVEVVGINIDEREDLTGIVWNEESATVGFTYKFTTQRTVWIENFFSVGFKLEYASRYRLGGVAVEDASADPFVGNIWTALLPFISSGQPVLLRPHPDDLLPKWFVSDGQKEGGEAAGRNGVLTWFTPSQPGTHTVKLMLSDGVAQFEKQVSVNVQARDQAPSASPTPSQ